jgi:hypothetical protein
MKISAWLNAVVTLTPPQKELVTGRWEAGRGMVWMLWRREKSISLLGIEL